MDLRQLQRFLIAAEAGSFRRAAEELHLTQPALTQSIKTLEQTLGVELFSRGSRGVALTRYGERLVPRARLILSERQRIEQDIEKIKHNEDGSLRVGVAPYFSRHILPRAVLRTLKQRPGLRIEVEENHTTKLLSSLIQGDIDLAFCVTNQAVADHTELTFEPVYRERYVVIARRDHPLFKAKTAALRDMREFPWIVYDTDATAGYLARFFTEREIPPPHWAIATLSLTMMAATVEQSDHLALLPLDFARTGIATGRLRIVRGHDFEIEGAGGLLTRRECVHSAPARVLMEQLRLTCAELQQPPEADS